MKRGPRPIPKTILKLRNSTALRKPTHKHTEPAAPKGCPSCPRWLDKEGKSEWKRIVESLKAMGILSRSDRAVLAGLCQNWSLFVRTSKQLNELPVLDRDSRPVATTNGESYRNYLRACEQFGLTPSARTRIDVDIAGKKPDAFDVFVQRKRG